MPQGRPLRLSQCQFAPTGANRGRGRARHLQRRVRIAAKIGSGEPPTSYPSTGGAEGVVRALEILEHEIQLAMALSGVARLDELRSSSVCQASPVSEPHALSGFPLLELESFRY